MDFTPLTAISPVDGRYRRQVEELSAYFSEFGLIKYRLFVEIEYFIALCEMPLPQLTGFNQSLFNDLRDIHRNFDLVGAEKIKTIEKTTNHDVKAVEYYIKEKFDALGLSEFKEFIHFGLTSQDINNTAIPMSIKNSIDKVYGPAVLEILEELNTLATRWAEIPMLARTHGQPASPTRLGKEIAVFAERLSQQWTLLETIPYSAKFGGATGNFNAHHVTYPKVNWINFGDNFVSSYLGLKRSHPTTQIEHYDHMAALFDNLKRINIILIDFCRDVWQYISMHYFKQKIVAGEIGSSAMPHKVNPIDFENAEGNLGIANAILEHLSGKLPISRLQRDLTDSTVLRNVGVPFSHGLIAFKSILKGIKKLELNEQAIREDLENNWAVVAEGIQNILRREGYKNPYETLLQLTRKNEAITEQAILHFIEGLEVSETIKEELKNITPFNYTGM